ncbi:hypothetical protein PVK06_036463 [Gossypium arboreum]|uniref:Uncharacterized protein n=1 Tax=Gossypium arboreum TaxID=29729 RepID=A0ABR0NJZ5_GOSAR|nr:hypothetical protein PVK06_036463 [Gossypium arboreum]
MTRFSPRYKIMLQLRNNGTQLSSSHFRTWPVSYTPSLLSWESRRLHLEEVELPLFTGKDPNEWLASLYDFFEFYNTENHHRVTMASFRMEGTEIVSVDATSTVNWLGGTTWLMRFKSGSPFWTLNHRRDNCLN